MIILYHLRKETEKRYVVQNLFIPIMPRTWGYDLKNTHNSPWTKAAELTSNGWLCDSTFMQLQWLIDRVTSVRTSLDSSVSTWNTTNTQNYWNIRQNHKYYSDYVWWFKVVLSLLLSLAANETIVMGTSENVLGTNAVAQLNLSDFTLVLA